MSYWIQYPHLTIDSKTHAYYWDGRRVVSVTKIFDSLAHRKNDKSPWVPFGCPEFAKQKSASEFGSALHKIANAISIGKQVKYPDVMKPYVTQIENFLSDNTIIPVKDDNGNEIAEYPMCSPKYGFCGQNDLFGRIAITGNLVLLDWKSSSTYQKNYSWQTAGYELLIREVFGGKLFDSRERITRVTVLISPDNYDPVYGDVRDKSSFLSLLNTYKLTA